MPPIPKSAADIPKDIQEILDHTPGLILLTIEDYKGKPYQKALLQKAFEKASGFNPAIVLQQRKYLEGKPYKAAILKKALGVGSEDMDVAQRIVSHFNDLHDSPDNVRFADLKYLTASQDFNLITLGRQQVYTSTYNGLLNDLLGKLRHNKQQLMEILTPRQSPQLSEFLEVASTYNRMDEVLSFIPQKELPSIIREIGISVANSPNMKFSTTLVTILLSLKENTAMRHLMEEDIKQHFIHAKTHDEKNRFGLIAATYGDSSNAISDDMKSFFLGIAANPTYHVAEVKGMAKNELVDARGANNQLMVFPPDADGIGSFQNWKSSYQGRAGWRIEETKTYVHIHSVGGKTLVNIYANKPNHYEDGLQNINSDLAHVQKRTSAEFQVFISRGHSYHLSENLRQITPSMKLIVLGSCGGHDDVERVLQVSPFAQMIVTQGMGSKAVNEPMLRHINESINKNSAIDWSQEQKELDKHHSAAADDYLLPHKDITMRMIRSFNKLQAMPQHEKQKLGLNIKVVDESLVPTLNILKPQSHRNLI